MSAGSRRRRAVAVGGAVACTAVVALLAWAYRHDPVRGWDVDVARTVGADMPRWAEWVARPFSWLGGVIGMTVISVAAVTWLAYGARRPREALRLAVAAVGVNVSTHALKLALDRARPSFDPAVTLPGSAAYPSGHASTAAAVLVLGALWVVGGRGAVAAATAVAVGIAGSRLVLGVHWLSDVTGGLALGGAWVGLMLALGVHGRR